MSGGCPRGVLRLLAELRMSVSDSFAPSRRELARALGVSPSTVHVWVWRAARRDWVVQRARRARAVRASQLGLQALERAERAEEEAHAHA